MLPPVDSPEAAAWPRFRTGPIFPLSKEIEYIYKREDGKFIKYVRLPLSKQRPNSHTAQFGDQCVKMRVFPKKEEKKMVRLLVLANPNQLLLLCAGNPRKLEDVGKVLC